MGKRYDQPNVRELVIPIMDGYKMACCDCGLVHRMEFGIVATKPAKRGAFSISKPRSKQTLRVTFKATIDKRATAAIRRRKSP